MKLLNIEMMVDDKAQPDFAAWAVCAIKLQLAERIRQNVKWGDGHFEEHSKEKILTILMEEVGELARAFLEHDEENAMEEAVQVAAVAEALVELLLKEYAKQNFPVVPILVAGG